MAEKRCVMMDRYTWTPVGGSPTVLNFSNCESYDEFHQILRKAFGFPAYYGENSEALWDLLDDFFGDFEEEPWEVRVIGWNGMMRRFGSGMTPYRIAIARVEKEYPNVRFVWEG